MSSRKWLVGGLGVALCVIVGWGTGFAGKESVGSVPLETVVDYIHSVLEADRTFYTVHVVERMQRKRNHRIIGTVTFGELTPASRRILSGVVESGGADGSTGAVSVDQPQSHQQTKRASNRIRAQGA